MQIVAVRPHKTGMVEMVYKDCNDETLVSITLLGDEKAYETLVTRYEKAVINAAYSVAGNYCLAEDAAQDAFVSAWMKLDMLKEHSKFRAWVCQIAKNCAKNLVVCFKDYICFDLLANTGFEQNMLFDDSFSFDMESTILHDSINSLSEKVRLAKANLVN